MMCRHYSQRSIAQKVMNVLRLWKTNNVLGRSMMRLVLSSIPPAVLYFCPWVVLCSSDFPEYQALQIQAPSSPPDIPETDSYPCMCDWRVLPHRSNRDC